ncbi:MAG: preprotein translocase subunit YajC [Bacteroidia bacterium]|nr:preprotein translocase subunit YajC [Bacteroidia bacterium]MDW8332753.1 preprotein translocase subunit YajC [Bacteroidia bacterium]
MNAAFFFACLAQAGGSAPAGGQYVQIIMMAGIFVVFYLFFIRPQMQRQKKEMKFRQGLEKGDKVVTVSGMYGKIVSLDEHTVTLEVDNNVKIRMERTAIRSYQSEGGKEKQSEGNKEKDKS